MPRLGQLHWSIFAPLPAGRRTPSLVRGRRLFLYRLGFGPGPKHVRPVPRGRKVRPTEAHRSCKCEHIQCTLVFVAQYSNRYLPTTFGLELGRDISARWQWLSRLIANCRCVEYMRITDPDRIRPSFEDSLRHGAATSPRLTIGPESYFCTRHSAISDIHHAARTVSSMIQVLSALSPRSTRIVSLTWLRLQYAILTRSPGCCRCCWSAGRRAAWSETARRGRPI